MTTLKEFENYWFICYSYWFNLFICSEITDFYVTCGCLLNMLSWMKHASPWMELLTRTIFECTHQKVIKVTAWNGMCSNGILLGPSFFEGNVNWGNYLQILDNLILPQLNERFHNRIENGMFHNVCGGCKMEVQHINSSKKMIGKSFW